jgi:hypothetical protein
MKFEIKSRWSGDVLFSLKTDSLKLCLQAGVKQGADLKGAYLEGADLEGADLKGADLKWADLKGAYLKGAYLEGADLKGAYLKGACLEGADLKGAYLEGADLKGAIQGGKKLDIPTLEKPYTQILSAIKGEGNSLDMRDWHTCETTHCIGGWVTHLAGEKGKALESFVGPLAAATLILKRSGTRIPNYFAENEKAMAFVEKMAAEEAKS